MAVDEGTAPGQRAVLVGLLGVVSIRRAGVLEPVPGARARSVLAALALVPGRFRSTESLIEEVWGQAQPRSPMNALHTQLSRLRTLLPEGALEAGAAGYRLTFVREEVDLTRAQGRLQAARSASAAGEHKRAVEFAVEAFSLWRGEPGADLIAEPLSTELRSVVAALRAGLEQVQLDAQLAQGKLTEALATLTERCERDPLDEPAHAQLMRCLVGLGRANEALTVFAGLRSRLAEGLGADPTPAVLSVHTAILRGELTSVPRHAPRVPAIGLRAAPNPLLGRERDTAALQELLHSSRVVTVLGPGGTGKTRVAQALGALAAMEVPVAMVELAGVRSEEDVIGAISATLGIGEAELGTEGLLRTRLRDVRERLRESLSARPSLLILDNCEHVVSACAEITADLVAASEVLTVLTTSRTPLMIAAEAVYSLPPLEIDEQGSPATELFCARARAVRPNARLDPVAVAALCRTLDGLPLAIELAAARVRTMTVEDISSRISNRFALLRGTDRTTPDRHRTLHAVIDWSWNLLDEAQRGALRRLCRFPGGFSREAAVAVAGWGTDTDIDSALDGLVNQSLLALDEHPEPVGLRYHMLETVREFGEEQLAAAPGEVAELAQRQARWARSLAQTLTDLFARGAQLDGVLLIEVEHENLVAALRWSVAARDPSTALTVFPVLAVYWAMRGAHTEVQTWAQRVVEIAVDPQELERVDPNLLVAGYVLAAGHFAVLGTSRSLARARTRLRRVLATGLTLNSAMRLLAEAILLRSSGAGLGRLLAKGVRSSSPETRCLAYMLRSNFQENSGNRTAAWRDAIQVLDLARQRGDLWVQGMAAQLLGGLNSQAARYEDAVDYFRMAARILWDLHAYEESAQARGFVGAALVGAGQVAAGRREASAALGPQPTLMIGGQPNRTARSEYESAVTATLAEAALAEGDEQSGLELYRRAVELTGIAAGHQMSGQYTSLVSSAAICAHVAAGERILAHTLLGPLFDLCAPELLAGRRGQSAVDLPITGALAVAVSGVDLHDPDRAHEAVRMLVMATRVGARQDYPSLRHDRQLAAARLAVGEELVDAEVELAAARPRKVLAAELVDVLVRRYQALRM